MPVDILQNLNFAACGNIERAKFVSRGCGGGANQISYPVASQSGRRVSGPLPLTEKLSRPLTEKLSRLFQCDVPRMTNLGNSPVRNGRTAGTRKSDESHPQAAQRARSSSACGICDRADGPMRLLWTVRIQKTACQPMTTDSRSDY